MKRLCYSVKQCPHHDFICHTATIYHQHGNHYEKLSAFIPIKGVKLFYTRHKRSEQVIINSYGFQGRITNNFGFTGINNIVIDFGLAQVNSQEAQSQTRAWLGLWHKW